MNEGEVTICLPTLKVSFHRDVPNVALVDEHTSVVDAAGETALVHLGLQATLQEVLDLEGQHVIELHARLVEHTDADETANDGVTLKETLGVLLVELEQLTGSTTDLGQSEGNAPDLGLVLQTVLTRELQLSIQTRALERTAGDLVSLARVTGRALAVVSSNGHADEALR